jgi:hypothetical protein
MPVLLSQGKQSNLRGARRRLCVFLSQADSEGALPYDIPRCRDWEWDRDRFYVYDDDRHPGWYVLINSRLGRSVHVEFFAM